MMGLPTRTGPMDPATTIYGHSRTRTISSSIFPSQHPEENHYQQHYTHNNHYPLRQAQHPQHSLPQSQLHHYRQQQQSHHQQQQQQQQQQLHPQHQQYQMHSAHQYHSPSHPTPHSTPSPQPWRRSPSIGAFSTTSSFHQPPPAAYRTSSSDLRRSTSSRSVGTISQHPGNGYVALLRKQKATVWCERAQYEDPRIIAQQRAAKMRANLEVVSGNSGRTQTGLASMNKVSGKIRHGKAPVVGYAPGDTHVGVGGVPLRLSAREIDGDGSDDDDVTNAIPAMASRSNTTATSSNNYHRRAGSSGRSSTGSSRHLQYRVSGSGTPARHPSLAGTPERSGSMVASHNQQQQPFDDSIGIATTDDTGSGRAQSSHSANSATPSERRDDVVELGQGPRLASNSKHNSVLAREKSIKSTDELKRRGSVDERSTTLTSGRLFIANPD